MMDKTTKIRPQTTKIRLKSSWTDLLFSTLVLWNKAEVDLGSFKLGPNQQHWDQQQEHDTRFNGVWQGVNTGQAATHAHTHTQCKADGSMAAQWTVAVMYNWWGKAAGDNSGASPWNWRRQKLWGSSERQHPPPSQTADSLYIQNTPVPLGLGLF